MYVYLARVILLLLIAGFEAACSGNVLCYTCAWLKTGGGTKAKEDNCRPGRFDANSVSVESCPRGCYTTIIYEYDPNKADILPMDEAKNCTDDLNTSHVGNMTLFARKCSEKSFMNDHCLIKSVPGFHAEERFCRANYCNAESGTASLTSTFLWKEMSSLVVFCWILPLFHLSPQLFTTINLEL